MTDGIADTAARLREAVESGDLALLEPLLDARIRWGGEEDTEDTCHSPSDVLATYGRLRAAGVRATVTEVIVQDEAVVLALALSGLGDHNEAESAASSVRYQVFRVANGLVFDIRGYPDRGTALDESSTPLPRD